LEGQPQTKALDVFPKTKNEKQSQKSGEGGRGPTSRSISLSFRLSSERRKGGEKEDGKEVIHPPFIKTKNGPGLGSGGITRRT
jgi:hypothetical protein